MSDNVQQLKDTILQLQQTIHDLQKQNEHKIPAETKSLKTPNLDLYVEENLIPEEIASKLQCPELKHSFATELFLGIQDIFSYEDRRVIINDQIGCLIRDILPWAPILGYRPSERLSYYLDGCIDVQDAIKAYQLDQALN